MSTIIDERFMALWSDDARQRFTEGARKIMDSYDIPPKAVRRVEDALYPVFTAEFEGMTWWESEPRPVFPATAYFSNTHTADWRALHQDD